MFRPKNSLFSKENRNPRSEDPTRTVREEIFLHFGSPKPMVSGRFCLQDVSSCTVNVESLLSPTTVSVRGPGPEDKSVVSKRYFVSPTSFTASLVKGHSVGHPTFTPSISPLVPCLLTGVLRGGPGTDSNSGTLHLS